MSMDRAMRRVNTAAQDVDDRSQYCCAHGCPNMWSIDIGTGKMCGPHYRAQRGNWPAVTEQQLRAQEDRAMRAGFAEQVRDEPRRPRPGAVRAMIDALQHSTHTTPTDPLAWARRLQAIHEHHGGILPNGTPMRSPPTSVNFVATKTQTT